MSDLLVKLYDQDFELPALPAGLVIKRGLINNKAAILDFVRANFQAGWVNECESALFSHPSRVWLAVQNHEIIGFACYETTAKNFFGPTGVRPDWRGHKVGQALLIKSLQSLKELGYAYAIIGWSDEATGFYAKSVGALEIPDSPPDKSIYQNLLQI